MSDQGNNDLVPCRDEINQMAREVFRTIGLPFEQTSELQRQVLVSFTFGMIFAIGQLRGLTPPEVHAMLTSCLIDTFHYANHQAAAFSEDLIASACGRGNPTTKAIIHRGIDGHAQWQRGDEVGLRTNLHKIFQIVGA
ncbi:MAG TPA: Imm48 family immunity protein [Terracidiphilus sp.]|jgi:hypothetical protein